MEFSKSSAGVDSESWYFRVRRYRPLKKVMILRELFLIYWWIHSGGTMPGMSKVEKIKGNILPDMG